MSSSDQVQRPLSTREIRAQLPKILKSYREQVDRAQPVVMGAYKRREAVLLPFEAYETLLEMAETGRRLSQERVSGLTRLSGEEYLAAAGLSNKEDQ